MQEAAVNFVERVDAGGSDSTPDYGGGEEGSAVGAGEAVGLIVIADVVNVAEHPEGDADLS